MTYQWELSGLFWFVVPNGFAVIAMIPFAHILWRNMPEGYTISEFIQYPPRDGWGTAAWYATGSFKKRREAHDPGQTVAVAAV